MSNKVNNVANAIKLYNAHTNFFYILGYDLVNQYDNLTTLINHLTDSDLANNILRKALFENANEYIVSLQLYPIANLKNLLSNQQTATDVIIGGADASPLLDGDNNPVSWAQGYLANKGDNINSNIANYGIFDMGTFTISEHFQNFLDYEPYTHIQLYLPYVGFIDLITNQVMGKELSIKYVVNWHDGSFNWFIESTQKQAVIQTGKGQLSIHIPIGSTNAQELARNEMNDIIGSVGSALMFSVGVGTGTAPLLATGIKTGMDVISNMANGNLERYSRGSFNGELGGWFGSQSPYLIITRADANSIDYNAVYGRPCGKTTTLSNLTGFSIVKNPLFTSTTATKEDVDEIVSLLANGVIL